MVSKEGLDHAIAAAVVALDAEAGCISQMLGDVLILVAEHVPGGGTLQTGHGYLVSDYPVTQDVLSAPRAAVVSLADAGADEAETRLLRDLGYDAVLMLPLLVGTRVWGLVEIYAVGRSFDDAAARKAEGILAETLAT